MNDWLQKLETGHLVIVTKYGRPIHIGMVESETATCWRVSDCTGLFYKKNGALRGAARYDSTQLAEPTSERVRTLQVADARKHLEKLARIGDDDEVIVASSASRTWKAKQLFENALANWPKAK